MVHVIVVVVAGDQAEGHSAGSQDGYSFLRIEPFGVLRRTVKGREVHSAPVAVLNHVAHVCDKRQVQCVYVVRQIGSLIYKKGQIDYTVRCRLIPAVAIVLSIRDDADREKITGLGKRQPPPQHRKIRSYAKSSYTGAS